MAILRVVDRLLHDEDGRVFLELDWDYNDQTARGVNLYGWRVVNGTTQRLVYRAAFYLDGALLFEREVLPGVDTGMVSVGSVPLERGQSARAFNPLLQRWRHATAAETP